MVAKQGDLSGKVGDDGFVLPEGVVFERWQDDPTTVDTLVDEFKNLADELKIDFKVVNDTALGLAGEDYANWSATAEEFFDHIAFLMRNKYAKKEEKESANKWIQDKDNADKFYGKLKGINTTYKVPQDSEIRKSLFNTVLRHFKVKRIEDYAGTGTDFSNKYEEIVKEKYSRQQNSGKVDTTRPVIEQAEGDPFVPATFTDIYLKIGVSGLSGTGKSYTALRVASAMFPGERIAVIDTEDKIRKYSREFPINPAILKDFHPDRFVALIKQAIQYGYKVLVIDTISHSWMGKGGLLSLADKFSDWKSVTPIYNDFVAALIEAPIHIFVTMRSKTDYAVSKNEQTGKQEVSKLGLAPVVREGFDYEFDLLMEMDKDHNAKVTKSIIPALDQQVFVRPGADVAELINEWLSPTDAE